jgi:hypothetical protein
MANSPYPSGGTVAAEPAPIDFDWASTALLIIDTRAAVRIGPPSS